MRRCLILSPHFPPSTLAGVHRARHLARHLPAHGWEPVIVTVDPRFHTEVLDPDLRSLVRAETRIIETGAIPAQLTIPFGLKGEIGLRGFFHLRAAIAREIKRFAPEVVLITGSPFYPMLLSRWIDRRWHIPVVLDFQDPWISAEGANRPRLSKGGISHILSTLLEPRALRGSRWITSVSDRQNEELASRSPWIDRARMSAIPIGGDPEDTRRVLSASSTGPCLSDKVTFSYVGNAWPRSIPVLRTLMKGLRLLKDRDPKLAERIRLRFVGTSNQPGGSRLVPHSAARPRCRS
jgi:hypothetical protein